MRLYDQVGTVNSVRNKSLFEVVIITCVLVSYVSAHGCTQQRKKTGEQIDIRMTITSPGNDYIATAYTVSGGGAGGYVYNVVNLRKKGEPFNAKQGVVFSATGSQGVGLWWQDNER